VGTLTSRKHIGLHILLQGKFNLLSHIYIYIYIYTRIYRMEIKHEEIILFLRGASCCAKLLQFSCTSEIATEMFFILYNLLPQHVSSLKGHPQVEHNIIIFIWCYQCKNGSVVLWLSRHVVPSRKMIMLCSTWGWPVGAETSCGKRLYKIKNISVAIAGKYENCMNKYI
jgi:hypothetical protein